MSAGQSAAAEAVAIRARARKGVWRRIQAWLGVGKAIRRADAVAERWERGAAAERATALLLKPLEGLGWHVRHDLGMVGRKENYDTVLVAPDGTVIVLDTKAWARNAVTTLVGGRVCCGVEDRHGEVEKVGRYANRIARAVGVPEVVAVVLVHGSPVAGGYLEARVPGLPRPVYVLTPSTAVPVLSDAIRYRDPVRAAQAAAAVDLVLRPYT
ncbi:nuclease-related domain-containing protein [Streptomyces xanthochromogenes]